MSWMFANWQNLTYENTTPKWTLSIMSWMFANWQTLHTLT
jgi:hypothetical protein